MATRMSLAGPLVALALLWGGAAGAQPDGPRPSQAGSVTQQVNQTTVTVKYSRPVARGRTLFGALVPFGAIWTPGANEATEITFSTAVKLNDQPVAAGTYSVWAVPDAAKWELILNSAHPVFHLAHASVADKDVLRVSVTPRAGAHMETLAWYFPVVDGRKAELVVHWGTTVVPLTIDAP